MSRPAPHELYCQAVVSHGDQGNDAVRPEDHPLLLEHGHLVPRPACTCRPPKTVATNATETPDHWPGCPRYQDNDRRLPCGWLPGERHGGAS